MKYLLPEEESVRLVKALRATLSIFLIDGIEDYIWEAVFAYTKNLPMVDPLDNIRSKLLFDVVDKEKGIGWSAKTTQTTITTEKRFELVIQRADIFSKPKELGFSELNKSTPAINIGNALLRHWNAKVLKDKVIQGVKDLRVCILLKTPDKTGYGYYEDDLHTYDEKEIVWNWTDSNKRGFQGKRKSDGKLIYRWYPSGAQLFESFIIPKEIQTFTIKPARIDPITTMDILINLLDNS